MLAREEEGVDEEEDIAEKVVGAKEEEGVVVDVEEAEAIDVS